MSKPNQVLFLIINQQVHKLKHEATITFFLCCNWTVWTLLPRAKLRIMRFGTSMKKSKKFFKFRWQLTSKAAILTTEFLW